MCSRNDDVTPEPDGTLLSTDLHVAPPGDNVPTTAVTMTVHLVTLERDSVNNSFGFTAGGEKPVVVRHVSVGKIISDCRLRM
jgi:hypothetical protein